MKNALIGAAAVLLLSPAWGDSIFFDGFEEPEMVCPAADQTRAAAVSVVQTGPASTYRDIWDDWGRSSGTRYVSVPNGQYAALPFTIPEDPDDDFAILIWDQIFQSPEQVRISVSKCESPPRLATSVSPRCYRQRNGSSGSFAMKTINSPTGCLLEKGGAYFFVVSFPACSRGACFWNVSEN